MPTIYFFGRTIIVTDIMEVIIIKMVLIIITLKVIVLVTIITL